MTLPGRVDRLVLNGTRRLVCPAASVANGGEQAALAGRNDLEPAVPPLHLGARLAHCARGGLAGGAKCRLDLIDSRRVGRLCVTHAFPGSDCSRCALSFRRERGKVEDEPI